MWIKDWWDRMLKKFKKEENISEAEKVMELKPEEAPEPVPERKTSDEMIVEMAESAAGNRNGMPAASDEPEKTDEPEKMVEPEKVTDPDELYEAGEPEDPEELYEAGEPEDPEELYGTGEPEDPEELYGTGEPEGPDPSEEVTWCEAGEDEERKDVDEEF